MSKIDSEIRTIHFLHIPKTGGTSMVETARQMQRGNWGRYDDELIGVLRPKTPFSSGRAWMLVKCC